MRNFQKLDVWKKSHELTLAIYQLTATFPSTNDRDLHLNYSARQPRLGQIWRKVAEEKPMQTSNVLANGLRLRMRS